MFLKMHLKNSTRPCFRWLMKSVETVELYNRSFLSLLILASFYSYGLPCGSFDFNHCDALYVHLDALHIRQCNLHYNLQWHKLWTVNYIMFLLKHLRSLFNDFNIMLPFSPKYGSTISCYLTVIRSLRLLLMSITLTSTRFSFYIQERYFVITFSFISHFYWWMKFI